jgi:hypothetical protein
MRKKLVSPRERPRIVHENAKAITIPPPLSSIPPLWLIKKLLKNPKRSTKIQESPTLTVWSSTKNSKITSTIEKSTSTRPAIAQTAKKYSLVARRKFL